MPPAPNVLVVSETPSLARCIADLLEIEGLSVRTVGDPGQELSSTLAEGQGRIQVVISASNGYRCETARRWSPSSPGDLHLVVVGSRDPELRAGPNVHVVGLPLAPDGFLQLVHGLLDPSTAGPAVPRRAPPRRGGKPKRPRNSGSRRNSVLSRALGGA